MFRTRSHKLERIDTGDYTPDEYSRYLREIAFINRYLGDGRALKKTLFREIEEKNLSEFSVLDVACGSGELLREIAEFARATGRKLFAAGIDINRNSVCETHSLSHDFREISAVQADAFSLPFANRSFDYVVCSLFLHHITDKQIPAVLTEMSRIARLGIFAIDLHRHPAAYVLYKLFCLIFRISPLVRHDGSLSIKKGFTSNVLLKHGSLTRTRNVQVRRTAPFRLILQQKPKD